MYLKFFNENCWNNEFVVRVDRTISKELIDKIEAAVSDVMEECEYTDWHDVVIKVMIEFAKNFGFTFETAEKAVELFV